MKLLFFVDPNWAFGLIHNELVKHLSAFGWQADLLPWNKSYQRDEMKAIVSRYDRVVTICSVLKIVLQDYDIPAEKVIVFAYSDYDIAKAFLEVPRNTFDLVKGYAVPSHNLLSISLALGVTRVPTVLPIGLTLSRYAGPIAQSLRVVGYGTALERKNHAGVEFKRGRLGADIANECNLLWRPSNSWHYLAVPGYWPSVDCCLGTALYETAPIPQLEAAASGRLVLCSNVGNVAELAADGIVEMLPAGENEFRTEAIRKLTEYRDDPDAYVAACERARDGVTRYDWSVVIESWMEFFGG